MTIAINKPMRRANSRCAAGNLSTRMEMKMMLSMPSTNSRAVRVAKAIQASGEVKRSMGQYQANWGRGWKSQVVLIQPGMGACVPSICTRNPERTLGQ